MAHPHTLNGAALRHLRKTRGHRSAATLAPHLGLTPAQLLAIERNTVNASDDAYDNILNFFGLEPGALLADPNRCLHCGAPKQEGLSDVA